MEMTKRKKFITRDGTIVSVVCLITNNETIGVTIESPDSILRYGFRHYQVDSKSGKVTFAPGTNSKEKQLDIIGVLPLDDEPLSLHVNNNYVTRNGDIVVVIKELSDIYKVRSTRFNTTYHVWDDGLCDKSSKTDGDIIARHISNFAEEVEGIPSAEEWVAEYNNLTLSFEILSNGNYITRSGEQVRVTGFQRYYDVLHDIVVDLATLSNGVVVDQKTGRVDPYYAGPDDIVGFVHVDGGVFYDTSIGAQETKEHEKENENEQVHMKSEQKQHVLEFKRVLKEKWYGPVFVDEDGDFYIDDSYMRDGYYQFSIEELDEIIHILTLIREFKESQDHEKISMD